MAAEIKILGMSNEDTCGCCGKSNLKRTVRVEVNGEEQHWGVVCASYVRSGVKNTTDEKSLISYAKFADQARSILAAGGTIADVSRLPLGYPCRVKDGKFQAYNGANRLVVEFSL